MILESLSVRDAGPFRGRTATIGPFSEGLNVLSAENEQGKTTLMRMLSKALFEKHGATHEDIKRMQPAGTSLSPSVQVDFRAAAGRWRLEKSFLGKPGCRLSEWVGGGWQPKDGEDKAEERLAAMLRFERPGRGPAKPEHWGLFRFLWSRQGEASDWPEWVDAAGTGLRQRLAQVEIDPLADRLLAEFHEAASKMHTSRGPKSGSRLEKVSEECAVLEAQLKGMHEQLLKSKGLERDWARLSSDMPGIKSQAEAAREAVTALGLQMAKLDGLRQLVEAASRDHAEAAKACLALRQEVARESDLTLKLAESTSALRDAETRITRLRQESQRLLAGKEDVRSQLRAATDGVAQADKAHEHARCFVDHLNAARQLQEAEARLARSAETRAEIQRLEAEIAAAPALSESIVASIEKLERAAGDLRVRLNALGLEIQLKPSTGRIVEWSADGKPAVGARPEPPTGDALRALREMSLKLQDWGEIHIRSGSQDVASLETELADAEAKLKAALLKHRAASLEEVRAALAARQGLEQALKFRQSVLKELVGEGVEALEREAYKLREKEERLAAQLRQFARPAFSTMSAGEFARDDAHESLKRRRQARADLEERFAAQEKEESQARTGLEAAEASLARLQTERATRESTLAELRQRHPEGLARSLALAEAREAGALQRLREEQAKLPPDADKLPDRLARERKAAADLESEAAGCARRLNEIEHALAALGMNGLHERRAEAEARLAEARLERLRLMRSAQSWSLMAALIERRRNLATRRVLAPLEDRLSASFAEISGESGRRVFLDESLSIAGVGRDRESAHSFDSLSQGAKEQLLLCLRLAVAAELSVEERQLVVLDDVLVNTDARRQKLVCDSLESAARTSQILVLTCHPAAYAGAGQRLVMKVE